MAKTPNVEIPVQFKITGEPVPVQNTINHVETSLVQREVNNVINERHRDLTDKELRLNCLSLAAQASSDALRVVEIASKYLDWVKDDN